MPQKLLDTNNSQTALERKRENTRRWKANNPQKVREEYRRRYLKNREKLIERTRCWQVNNPEKTRAIRRRWKENNPTANREGELRREYGMTITDFESLNHKQNGLCCICQKNCQKHKVLSVDHCHKTGRVRGLLCKKCNSGLGFFNDDFSLLMRAANYIGWKN